MREPNPDPKARIRYQNEHGFLPTLFFKHTDVFLTAAIKKKGALFAEIFNSDPCSEVAQEFDWYTKDDFDVLVGRVKDRIYCIVKMPEPEEFLNCKMLGFSVDKTRKSPQYRTIEKSEAVPYMMCGWTPSGDHLNFGDVEDNPQAMVTALIASLDDEVDLPFLNWKKRRA